VGECVCYEVSVALDFIDLHVVASASTVWLAGWSESQMLVFTVKCKYTCLEKLTNCISVLCDCVEEAVITSIPVFKSGNALDFVRIDFTLIIFSIIRIMSLTVAGSWNDIYIHYSFVVVGHMWLFKTSVQSLKRELFGRKRICNPSFHNNIAVTITVSVKLSENLI